MNRRSVTSQGATGALKCRPHLLFLIILVARGIAEVERDPHTERWVPLHRLVCVAVAEPCRQRPCLVHGDELACEQGEESDRLAHHTEWIDQEVCSQVLGTNRIWILTHHVTA